MKSTIALLALFSSLTAFPFESQASGVQVELKGDSQYTAEDAEQIKAAILSRCRGIVDRSNVLREVQTDVNVLRIDGVSGAGLSTTFEYTGRDYNGTAVVISVRRSDYDLQVIAVVPDTTQICEL